MERHKRLKRSAGTVLPWDLTKNRMRGPSEAASAEDIAAVDRGDGRTVFGAFRGLYGSFPRTFRGYLIDLTGNGLVLRPLLGFSFLWRRVVIEDAVESAAVRPFENEREALKLLATGQYAPGGKLEWAGSQVITCRTAKGVLEFSVKRPDVPLMLHYLHRLSRRDAVPGDERPVG